MTRPATDEELQGAVTDAWSDLHTAVLRTLLCACRVTIDEAGTFHLLTPAEASTTVKPDVEPLATVYDHGSVPGAHDNAIFALLAWYESQGLSWEETKARVCEWLRDSGAWDRGGFSESSPEAVLTQKAHVHAGPGNGDGYGWRTAARAAKRVITQRR